MRLVQEANQLDERSFPLIISICVCLTYYSRIIIHVYSFYDNNDSGEGAVNDPHFHA